ncbi:MAG: trimeric autotransporter adhesin, partial [Solirubrobacterales bacterium]|nr:trimeric autotransporter adhesin [Solirubrobacterales bacterium]
TIAVEGDNVYFGGSFHNVDGEPRSYLAAADATDGALNPDWKPDAHSLCTPVAPATSCSLPGYSISCTPTAPATSCELPTNVMAIDLTKQTVYVGGAFAQIGGAARNRLAAIYPIGAIDENNQPADGKAMPGWDPQANDVVRAIDASCDTVFAGGTFTKIGTPVGANPQPARNRLAALSPVGATDGNDEPIGGQATPWNPDADSAVFALTHSSDRSIEYAGGGFSTVGDLAVPQGRGSRKHIAALRKADGGITGWNPSADGTVRSVSVGGGDQTVYAGGSFFSIGGETRNKLAALQANGTGDATAWNPDPNDSVQALVAAADNAGHDKLYVGGSFTEMDAGVENGFAAFTSNVPPATVPDDAAVEAVPDCPNVDMRAPTISNVTFGTDHAIHYTLSENATVAFAFVQKVRGFELRKALSGGGSAMVCVRLTARNERRLAEELRAKLRRKSPARRRIYLTKIEKKRRCVASVSAGRASAAGIKGDNVATPASLHLKLAPGAYTATLSATDAAGNTSLPATLALQL